MKLLSILLTSLVLMSSAALAEPSKEVFRHVVFFKFKDDATPEQVKAIEEAFAELPSKIDTITDYEWGTTQSVEGKNEGFTHCFLVTFKDKAGLETYIPHPDHKEFVKLLKPSLEKVMVFDYTPGE